ncbi:hypothetical protein [Sabulibacter ruber]|uniref:hypothetical protein n=1 Tax=Sabulibacter ruber TaxID=2811901 RepID=UPI001A96FB77|nr:hypothetical protein [Sabulibacter ruber]
MWFSKLFRKRNYLEERIKYFYENPERLFEIEFANHSENKKSVWVEPTCIEFELDTQTEYKIVTHDKFVRLEFDGDGNLIFYLQHSFGFKLYKRPASKEVKNRHEWEPDNDTSEIN